MRIRINELLTIARLPAALWTGLHGGREYYDNPGSSVMSFCVRNIGAEFADTPENDIEESIKQCRDFSTKREHIDVILAHLEVLAATIGSTCSKLGEAESKMVFREFNEMVKYSQEVKKLRSALEVNGLMPARLDTTTQIYPTFVQAILELNWAISNLNGLVAMINETSKA